jgi:hypothetical protein
MNSSIEESTPASHISDASQEASIMESLLQFYENKEHLQTMHLIITGQSKISLRLVDWFVTNYAKKEYTWYNIIKPNGKEYRFKVYVEYKNTLRSVHKVWLDPFCRCNRVQIPYLNGEYIQTTIGQLNFFRWAITNKVIHYINEHYDEIDADMTSRNSTSKRANSTVSETDGKTRRRKRRTELSVSATKNIKKENVEITISFEK